MIPHNHIWSIVFICAVACGLISCEGEIDQFKINEVNPPGEYSQVIQSLSPPISQYSLDPQRHHVLALSIGYLEIDASSFVNENGEPLQEELLLDVRILRSPTDFMRSDATCRWSDVESLNPHFMLHIQLETGKEQSIVRIEKPLKLYVTDFDEDACSVAYADDEIYYSEQPWTTYSHRLMSDDFSLEIETGHFIFDRGLIVELDQWGWYAMHPTMSNITPTGSVCIRVPQFTTNKNSRVYYLTSDPPSCIRLHLSPTNPCDFVKVPTATQARLVLISHLGANKYQAATIVTDINPGDNRFDITPIGLSLDELRDFISELY